MIIQKGDKAPNFCLYNTEQEQVTLQDLRGEKVLILFFPFAWSDSCTEELDNVRNEIEEYEELDAKIIAISVDSPYSLDHFKEHRGFPFILLSDFNKEVSRAYGTLYEDFTMDLRGVSKRSAFVIDQKGTVQYAEVLDKSDEMPNFNKIKEVLADIDS